MLFCKHKYKIIEKHETWHNYIYTMQCENCGKLKRTEFDKDIDEWDLPINNTDLQK